MARHSTPSLWLPGFAPDGQEPIELAVTQPLCLPVATAAVQPIPLPPQEFEPMASAPSASWRTGSVTSTPPRDLWPTLHRTHLQGLAGPVAKFEANLTAIGTLLQLEAQARTPSIGERRALLRFTGWGGIPAAFNLETGDAPWRQRAERLQALLPADAYASARASVNNSHYTEVHVVEAMWQAIAGFGFTGGRVLEPAAGVGHFIGAMPADLARHSAVTAVEIDEIAGRILQALYAPHGVDVHVSAFEKLALPEHWFDLVVGNVPFGNYAVADHSHKPYARFRVHNYFLARALDLVRPGGLVACITSTGTMEASTDTVRAHLAAHAELLGAIRLPMGAFAGIASTDVQTDILFLRKRHTGEAVNGEWLHQTLVPPALLAPGDLHRHLRINAWYAARPQFCIGQVTQQSNGYEPVPTVVFTGDLEAALRERVAQLPQGVYTPAPQRSLAPVPAVLPATPGERPGSYRIRLGREHRVAGEGLVDVHNSLNATQRARISGLCTVRDQARALLDAQLAQEGDEGLGLLRAQLNLGYDRYVARHGCLSSRANALAFRRDPDYPLLLSLEHYDEESDTARKAAVFTQRTLRRVAAPTAAGDPAEALATSMQWRGRVDPAFMATLLGAAAQEVLDALSEAGQVFLDPEDACWTTADDYLSGNVRHKLLQARLSGPAFGRNAQALQRVQPEDLPPSAIAPRLGAVWIPAADIEAFVHEVLALPDCTVRYSAEAGAWSVVYPEWRARQNVKVTQEWGTARMHAVELLQAALNVQVPTVRDRDPLTDRYHVNPAETLAAREKFGALKERFADWAFEDSRRRERLCSLYNTLFNATRPRRFDGAHLKLPGCSHCFALHPHQLDAVWRIVQTGNVGLFHAVGAGKTAVCVIASMEMRRLGFLSKPCHVVPNHMLAQYTAELVRLYPQASVLMAGKDDLQGDSRRELAARIATGDWDAVVITHASFERIRMSAQLSQAHIAEVVHDLEMAIRAEHRGDRSNRIIKQLEAQKKTWRVRLERLQADGKKDDLLSWEQLGVDGLFIDEAHLFKNLYRFTKMTRVAGLPLANSERSFDLYLKTRYTMQLHQGAQRGVVFATATPVANSMAEIHTMQRYLQPRRLQALGLQQFDAWAATFGEAVTALEIAPDGSGYRLHTRFARFVNVPELMAVFGEVADIRTAEMLALPVPRLRGGKARTVACPASAALKAFVQTLVARSEAIRQGHIDPRADNMLAVTNDGRAAALDFRLVAPAAGWDPQGKVGACVREVLDVWRRSTPFRGAQLVFCDLSSPQGGKTFSVYEDLRQRLIEAGVPAQEIAFIHDAESDAQKAALFKAVREGRTRVLLGSTGKMGLGTNVQTRLVALHHLDAPWRPCDVEQREGRILRQGNTCEEVEIFRYVTEQSFDAYMWQTLETKARFIAQVMRGDQGLRAIEDVELATLSYAEVKALASGNPLVIEKAGVDADVARLSTLFSVWRNQRWANESEIGRLPLVIEAMARRVVMLAQDLEMLATREQPGMENLEVDLHGRRHVGAAAVGDALREVVKAAREEMLGRLVQIDRIVGRCAGFELGIAGGHGREAPALYLAGQCRHELAGCQTGPALVGALLGGLADIAGQHARAVEQLALRQQRLQDLQRELARPFEHEARLTDLLVRQRALHKALDLDRDQAGSAGADPEAERQAA